MNEFDQTEAYRLPCLAEIKDLPAFIVHLKGLYPHDHYIDPKQMRQKRIIHEIYLPILEDNHGYVPTNHEFVDLCQSLNVNRYRINDQIKSLYLKMHLPVNTKTAADYLKLSPRTVRRLAKSGVLPASKVGSEWSFTTATLNSYLRRYGYSH